ncbi:hypothetical protein RhiirC2_776022 [Rhizophagus irregularis]|uniref:Tc1-like transposase DDE domain-containing protein n=1 Tax=Rhizophagus irregularis TaxID=588596 RepID=A0A2N1NHY8_9GLOM|nr:hypothetical protein RhiirC2_776022 [Rhizophagus irregularis]
MFEKELSEILCECIIGSYLSGIKQCSIISEELGVPKSTVNDKWMSSHAVPILDWVAQSPDLNPIENLWNHLDRQVRKRKPLPKFKQELISAVQEEWGKLL